MKINQPLPAMDQDRVEHGIAEMSRPLVHVGHDHPVISAGGKPGKQIPDDDVNVNDRKADTFEDTFEGVENKTILWWGRFDPSYSRNVILRENMRRIGFRVLDFRPFVSFLGDLEAHLKKIPPPDFVWVPCFRHRDIKAAARWAARYGVPVFFDPLISSYQKRLYERKLFKSGSLRERHALAKERCLFARASHVVADTLAHRDLYRDMLLVPPGKLSVIYVGASDDFREGPNQNETNGKPIEVLFYGSFLPLHGIPVIIEAARRSRETGIHWTILGDGPEKRSCLAVAKGLSNLRFEDPVPYEKLCARVHEADIVLGIFGDTAQAARVIPNKVFQALAAGRPVITRVSAAYPPACAISPAIAFVPPADPDALVQAVRRMAGTARSRSTVHDARALYDSEFSQDVLQAQLKRTFSAAQHVSTPKTSPTVSVIIPVFNVAPYLARCLDSVLNQTYENLEIICIDDGSTDACGTILADYAQKDPRMRVITFMENRGPSAARNAALDVFTGDYVVFIDSDDWIPLTAIRGFVDVAAASGAPVVVSGSYGINSIPENAPEDFPWTIRRPALKHLIRSNKIKSSVCNKCYRADVVRTRRFIEDIYFEDWPFLTELFGDLPFFALIKKPLYVYCINTKDASIVHSPFSRYKIKSYMRGIEHIAGYFRFHPQKKWAERRIRTAQQMMIGKIYKTKTPERDDLFRYYEQISRKTFSDLHALGFKTWYRIWKLKRLVPPLPYKEKTNED